MDKIKGKEKTISSVFLAVCLLVGFTVALSRGQAEEDAGRPFELASAQLSPAAMSSPVISMDFQDANLKDVLKVFSQQAGLNFIASEKIKDRKVTLYLDRVSVEDALNTIMRANWLTYEQKKDSKIFIVKETGQPEIDTVTKVFPLQYARVKGSELTAAGEDEVQEIEVGIKEVIEKLLSKDGKIVEDARTNSLIITDVPGQFPEIEKTIKELDAKLPQVMIEAEIIEAKLETIDKLGIEWGNKPTNTLEGEFGRAFGAVRSATFPFTKPQKSGKITTEGIISAKNLGGVLALLSSDTDTKILARPKILTLNNETAEIRIVSQTATSSTIQNISTAGEGISSSITGPERMQTGVTLKVTPQINKLGEITMSIEPSVINTSASTILGSTLNTNNRSAKTTVTIRDGETVIIGGLIDTSDSKVLRKVPFFGDIPLLGNLFRKKDDSSSDREVIIFITPHLVKDGAGSAGLALKKQLPWEYERLGLKEEAMERILDKFEE